MFQPHQRAALIPNGPGVKWPQWLGAPFVQPGGSFAVVVQGLVQRGQEHLDLKGLIEISSGASLPVIFPFDGVLNLETREISIHQAQPEKSWSGQISANGRVMTLQEAGQAKPIHLVHEQTLDELI
jgi:hypothetical protein